MAKQKGSGKPGRPKGKPLTERERAQRRAAALKHGEYAETALAQALPPCKPAVCPAEAPGGTGFPCDVKRTIESRGGGLSSCLLALGEASTIQKFQDAILKGDTAGLAELAATSLAAKSLLEHRELGLLLEEGLVIEVPIVGKGPDGPEIIGYRQAENPRAASVAKLSEQLGRTAADQVITPKSRGEKARDEGVGRLGHLAWISGMRQGLNGGGEE